MNTLQALIEQENLPASFTTNVLPVYQTLANYLATKTSQALPQQSDSRSAATPLLVAINGAQGTGKSTLALFLKTLLEERQLHCAVLSIDDFYFSHAKRQSLASNIHPLLATRGVPGTHDLKLAQAVIEQLRSASNNTTTALPSFNKAEDDRRPEADWPMFRGKPDIIIIEGWCMAAKAMPQDSLQQNPNTLEQDEDPNCQWRHYINQQLQRDYASFFAGFELLIMLKAPSFEAVSRWRAEQEAKLAKKMQNTTADNEIHKNGAINAPFKGIMSENALQRFMMHYERLTRCMLEEMPSRADVLMELKEDHSIGGVIYRTE